MSQMDWVPTSPLAKAVYLAGFRYEPGQDIIYSRFEAWQRGVGFCWAYDVMSAPLHMIIDCEIFYFWYNHRPWLVELWKGQYGLETGAEIGVYRDDAGAVLALANPKSRLMDPKSRFYKTCVPLNMRFTLKRNGKILLARKGFHWWLTGFKWGVFTDKTSDLVMDLEITCENQEMRDAFNEAVMKRGYPNSARGRSSIAFTFHRPKTVQPESRTKMEGTVQSHNSSLVDGYNGLKLEKNIRSNDPNAFTDLDKDARKGIQVVASAAAKKIQNKTPALAKTIMSKTQHVAQNVQHKAAAEFDKLQDLSDEARTAYDEIFTFFNKKVWHVTRF